MSTPTTPDPVLRHVPAHLLLRGNAPRLVRWLEDRGHHPTLLAVEQERTRRGITPGTTPEKEK